MNESTRSDGLITMADIQQFKDEVNRGSFKTCVFEMAGQEPELAIFISERYCKTLQSLAEAGIDGRRLAALHKHISLMVWGSAILVSRAHRRQIDCFLPSDATAGEGSVE